MKTGLFNDYLITFTSAAIILLLATLMWCVRIPDEESLWSNIRTARTYMSTAYIMLGIIGPVMVFCLDSFADNIRMFSTATAIESVQVMLLTAAITTLLYPRAISRRWLVQQSVVSAIIIITLGLAIHYVKPEHVMQMCHAAATIYAAQLVYYIIMFRKVYYSRARIITEHKQHYNPERIRKTFDYLAIMAILSLAIDLAVLYTKNTESARTLMTVFLITFTLFYAYLMNRFYNYIYTLMYMHGNKNAKPAAVQPPAPSLPERTAEAAEDICKQPGDIPEKDIEFGKILAQWVEEKKYLNKDITIEDVTAQLGTTKKYIYYYFRTYMNSNFRTWRTELRIKEALKILAEKPDITLEEIADMTGFNHRANFFQQFQKVTGMSPTEYKKQQ